MVGTIMGRQMTARVTVRMRDHTSVRMREPETVRRRDQANVRMRAHTNVRKRQLDPVRGHVQKAKVQVGGSDRTFAARLVDILIATVVAYFAF